MDHYQGVVEAFLSSDPAVFVKPECLITLDEGQTLKGRHWYCDIVAVSFRSPGSVYLCEVTLDGQMKALEKRLREWSAAWSLICEALIRDNLLGGDLDVRPWVFVPERNVPRLSKKVAGIPVSEVPSESMPRPLVTPLEAIPPWVHKKPPELPGAFAREA